MKNLNILSLGAGLQSSVLYYMSSLGFIPKADFAIIADPGKEKKRTYQYIEYLINWQRKNNGVPIIIVSYKNLYQDLLNNVNSTGNRFSSIPCFTKNEDGSIGMLRRQCTNEYKIEQVDQAIRKLYGLKKKQWTPKTFVWKGISIDEIQRMAQPIQNWKTSVFPFCGYFATSKEVSKLDWAIKMNRLDCENWLLNMNLPVPPKSACIFCPYMSDHEWQNLKVNDPEDFECACLIDEAIRNSTAKGIKAQCFLHETCIPLRDVKFNQLDIWKGDCASDCHF